MCDSYPTRGGKTLCEILTVRTPCRCPWLARGSTITCPGTAPCGHLFNEKATALGTDCHGVVAIPLLCRPILAQKPCLLAACMSRHPTMPSASRRAAADAERRGCPAFAGCPKAGSGTAARLGAGNCGEGLACLFRVCAILPHQACADGSVFFCRWLFKAGLSGFV